MSEAWDNFVPPPAHAAAKPGWMQNVSGFMANVNRGLGVGDEMAAGINTARDIVSGRSGPNWKQTFQDEMAHQRQTEDGFTAQHPHVAALARGTGNALLAAAPVGPGAEAFAGGNVATNALRGATTAGLTGAAYGAVDRGTVAERLHAASAAATDPVTLGLGAVGGIAATAGRPRSVAPSYEQLETAKKAAYKAMDDSGVTLAPGAFSDLAAKMATNMDAEGGSAGLHPKASAMIDKIGQSAAGAGGDFSPTLTQLDQLRQQIGRDVASSNDPGERRMGTIMRNTIDEFLNSAGPEQLTGADPETAVAMLNTGRGLNTRLAKLDALDDLDEAASDRAAVTGSGGNGQNALRQNVVRFKNDVGNLTPDEAAATQTAIDGTPTQNVLRQVGKLSPEGNTLMGLAHTSTMIGEVGTGHSPAALTQGAVALGGAVAKRASDAIAQRNVQALRDLIASGGDAAQAVSQQLSDPAYAELRGQVANDLSAQAGVQGTDARSQTVAPAAAAATPSAPVDPWENFVPATSPQ